MEPNEQDQLDELLNDIAVQMGYQPGGAGPTGEHPLSMSVKSSKSMAGSLHAYFASAQHQGFISQGTYDALRAHYGQRELRDKLGVIRIGEEWTY